MSSSPLSICGIQRDLEEKREDYVGHLGGRRGRVKRRLETHEVGEDNARELSRKKESPIGGHIDRGRKAWCSLTQAMSISRQKGAKQGARRSNGRDIARNREARGGEIDRAKVELFSPSTLGLFGAIIRVQGHLSGISWRA